VNYDFDGAQKKLEPVYFVCQDYSCMSKFIFGYLSSCMSKFSGYIENQFSVLQQ
jgi:hypothetical protein